MLSQGPGARPATPTRRETAAVTLTEGFGFRCSILLQSIATKGSRASLLDLLLFERATGAIPVTLFWSIWEA